MKHAMKLITETTKHLDLSATEFFVSLISAVANFFPRLSF